MNRTVDDDIELRLARAFARGGLPAAPYGLGSVLERVPDMPVRSPRAMNRRAGWALAGLAAAVALGGALAIVGAGHDPSLPVPSIRPLVPDATRLTYAVEWTAAVPFSANALADEAAVVSRRLAALPAAAGAVVTPEGPDRLVVDLPPDSAAEARRVIGQRGLVGFVPLGHDPVDDGAAVDPARFPALFDGSGVQDASVDAGGQSGRPTLRIQLTSAASALFGDYTAGHVGDFLAITVDGRAVSVPMIQSGIAGGSIEIGADGSDPLPTLEPLAAILRSGPLPVALTEISVEGPSPAPLRSAPASTALPSEVTIVPSLEPAPLPSDVAVQCAPPIDVAGPQIGCQEAIDSALSVLPANRPRIAEIRFVHSCDDTSQYLADCAVQAFGWVSIQFVDGRSIAIEVVLGSRPRLLIDKRHVPDAPPFPLSEARPGDRCTDPWARGDAVTIGIDPVLADPVWAYTSDLTPVEIRFGPGLRSVSGPIPLILTSHTVVLAHSGTTMLPGRDVMLPGVDVCRTADGALLVVERDS